MALRGDQAGDSAIARRFGRDSFHIDARPADRVHELCATPLDKKVDDKHGDHYVEQEGGTEEDRNLARDADLTGYSVAVAIGAARYNERHKTRGEEPEHHRRRYHQEADELYVHPGRSDDAQRGKSQPFPIQRNTKRLLARACVVAFESFSDLFNRATCSRGATQLNKAR